MMTPTDVYAPWREQLSALESRHVGREEELHLLERTVRKFIAGDGATHLYLFGPRGTGKSHLLALLEKRLRSDVEAASMRLLVVPEDIAEHRKASDLLARIEQFGVEVTAFGRRTKPATPAAPDERPRVILMEGFDRQLGGMSKSERRALRAGLLREGPPTLLITTGIGLTEAFTGANEAFFGALLPRALNPLNADEAAKLLEAAAGADIATRDHRWGARKPTLLALAGGTPRTLIALGIVSANNPNDDASERLFQVMNAFTAHYQLTFRDLPPQGQRIVEVLAAAPAAMTPTELAEALGDTPSAVSVVCNRLMNDGALARESEGKSSYYRLPEPLFRYWLEYRNLPWEHTRVGMLSRLVEAVYTPDEVADLWLEQRGLAFEAVEEIYKRNEPYRAMGVVGLLRELQSTANHEDWARYLELGDRLDSLPLVNDSLSFPDNAMTHAYAAFAILRAPESTLGQLIERFGHLVPPGILSALQFAADLEHAPESALENLAANYVRDPLPDGTLPRYAREFFALVTSNAWLGVVSRALSHALNGRTIEWQVSSAASAVLPAIPGIRGMLARYSRYLDAPPVTTSAIVSSGLGPFEPDFDDLMRLALEQRHTPLFSALCESGEQVVVHTCVEPTLPVPVRSNFVRALTNSHHLSGYTEDLISWLATLVDYSDEAFEPILNVLSAATLETEPGSKATLALLDLYRSQRPRYDRVRAAVTDEKLHAYLDNIEEIAAQLDGPPEAHLHPELAHFRALLDAPPRRFGEAPIASESPRHD